MNKKINNFFCKFFILFYILFFTSKLSSDVLIIDESYSNQSGMFATANKILGQLYLYEAGLSYNLTGLIVDFDTFGLYYDPQYGKNWWNYYFEPIAIGSLDTPHRVATIEEMECGWKIRRRLSKEKLRGLVAKYFHPLPWIRSAVDAFKHRYFDGFFIIGVHYRGTDKKKEAPRLSYGKVFRAIRKHIPVDLPYKIFVATDEALFLESIQKEFPDQIIAADAHRSSGSVGIHFSSDSLFEIGKEAVIDALLLAYCDLLIRTSSNLSLWSTYFNPDLPEILLNQRFADTLDRE